MKGKKIIDTDELYYELGAQIVNEAFIVYKQTNQLSPDFSICKCSIRQTLDSIKQHVETGAALKYVKVSFRDMMQVTSVYVNIESVWKRIVK